MQSFGDLFANNRLLALGLLLAALAIILAVGIGLFRLTFGRRLHMAGGRTRQPRLGVVDAFDLDRQRQLVIVRRDNVEHLLMIGGPNDVLIEAAIVRTAVGLNARDKENGNAPSVGIPAPAMQPVGTSQPGPVAVLPGPSSGTVEPAAIPVPAPAPAPEPQVSTGEKERVAVAVEPAATAPAVAEPRLPNAPTLPAGAPRPLPPRATPSTIPPRPPIAPAARSATMPVPRPSFSRATPVAPPAGSGSPPPRVEPVLGRTPNAASSAEDSPAAPVPSVGGRTDERSAAASAAPPVGTGSLPPAPPRPPMPARPASPPPPPRPQIVRNPPGAPTQAAGARSGTAAPSLGSLEEEMAKLLGRPMPPPDQSNG